MDRRDFLKAIGLGGVTLTLPLPLRIVAAKIADLADPPLHAGYAEIWGPHALEIYDVGIECDPTTTPEDFRRFGEFTTTYMFVRRENSANNVGAHFPLMKAWTSHLLGELQVKKNGWVFSGGYRAYPLPRPLLLQPNDRLEFWIVPKYAEDGRMLGKVIPATISVSGLGRSTEVDKIVCMSRWEPLQSVRVDRARAIELGLADPPESSFFDFPVVSPHSRRIDSREEF